MNLYPWSLVIPQTWECFFQLKWKLLTDDPTMILYRSLGRSPVQILALFCCYVFLLGKTGHESEENKHMISTPPRAASILISDTLSHLFSYLFLLIYMKLSFALNVLEATYLWLFLWNLSLSNSPTKHLKPSIWPNEIFFVAFEQPS